MKKQIAHDAPARQMPAGIAAAFPLSRRHLLLGAGAVAGALLTGCGGGSGGSGPVLTDFTVTLCQVRKRRCRRFLP